MRAKNRPQNSEMKKLCRWWKVMGESGDHLRRPIFDPG